MSDELHAGAAHQTNFDSSSSDTDHELPYETQMAFIALIVLTTMLFGIMFQRVTKAEREKLA